MNDELSGLYQRICAYSPDDAESCFSFTDRLARENGWSLEFARRVTHEYKRFMFLAVAAGHPVTPSDQVDQAWHLHLVYTRSYWDSFCGQVLRQKVHHGPTKGGPQEQAKFREWYDRTKVTYCQMFGEAPPVDVWPNSDVRFGHDIQWVRVNQARNWIVPKRCVERSALVGLVALVAVTILISITRLAIWDQTPENVRLVYSNNLAELTIASQRQNVADPIILTGWSQQPAYPLARVDQNRLSAPPDLRASTPDRSKTHLAKNPTFFVAMTIGATLFFILIIREILFGNSCSACGRAHANKKTGNYRKDSSHLAGIEYEWACKYCGATKWKLSSTGDGGCSGFIGCGGDADCGGGCAGGGCGGGCGGG